MKPPEDAILNLKNNQKDASGDGSLVTVSGQALHETLEWTQWAYFRICQLENEVDELETELVDPYDDEDELEPKGDQW